MTTQLPERLRELADDAPASLSASGLWHDGRRRHRRRMTTAAAAVGVLAMLTAGAGVGAWRSSRPEPAAPAPTRTGVLSIPDRLFNPSPWTPTTRTPGRLVAVMTATRDHYLFGSDQNAVAGVAAGSQAYRFLNLPGQDPEDPDVALSPDGLHLAYWIDGQPPQGRPAGAAAHVRVGAAVLDLTTGHVERHDLRTAHGLGGVSLAWADAHTVVVDAWPQSRQATFYGSPRIWMLSLGGSAARETALTDPSQQTAAVSDGFGVVYSAHRLRIVDPSGDRLTQITTSRAVQKAAYDPSRRLVAAVIGRPHSGRSSQPLAWGRVRHGRVRLTTVPGAARYLDVVAWVDARHVVAVRLGRLGISYGVVDLDTGSWRLLTSKPWYSFTLAADALHRAVTVPGIAPPARWNLRAITLWGLVWAGLLFFFGYVGLVVWRQRVRA